MRGVYMWMEERNDQIHLKGEALGGFLKAGCWEGKWPAKGTLQVAGESAECKHCRKKGDGTMEVAVLAGILQRRGGGGGTCRAVAGSALPEAG